MGGPGVFRYPLQEHFILENPEWKYDAIPEIINGKNIFDYVDPEIEKKLMMLEEEQKNYVMPEEELLNEKEKYENQVLEQVRDSIYDRRINSKLNNNRMLSKEKIDVKSLKEKLNKKGLDSTRAVERLTEQQKKRTL